MQEASASGGTEHPYNEAQEIFEVLTGMSMSDHAMHEIVGNLYEEVDVLDIKKIKWFFTPRKPYMISHDSVVKSGTCNILSI